MTTQNPNAFLATNKRLAAPVRTPDEEIERLLERLRALG